MSLLTRRTPSSVSRWDPFRELRDMRNRIDQMFSDFPSLAEESAESPVLKQWEPSVDISEDDKEYLITAELPEIKKEDVKVDVENGVLSISGDRKFEKEEKNKKYHRIERAYGSFYRSFSLPEDAKEDDIKAEFDNGILKVHVTKQAKPEAKKKEIAVQ